MILILLSFRKSTFIFFILFYFFISFISISQTKNVGIGTLSPDSSAILHLEANNKGILIPRVFLQSDSDITTIINPATALLIYNTNSIMGEGFYYWNGTQWIQAIGPIGPTGSQGPIGLTGPTGPAGPVNVDSLTVNYATIDSLFSNYIYTDTIFANFASFDSIYATSANFDSLYINGTSIDSFVSGMIDTVAWKQIGNSGTSPAVNFLGNIDSVDLVFRTNNQERARINANGGTSVSSLTGSGTRMVTADSTGLLNTQSVPDGIPQGGIIMWSGTIANIPAGWALCDGTNGTPDLTDKFILSVSSAAENPGATGGVNSYSLTTAQLPSHNHTVSGTTSSDGAFTPSGTISSAGSHNHTGTTSTDGSHIHNMSHGHSITDPQHRHSFSTYDCGSGGDVPTWDDDDGCQRTNYTSYSSTGITVNNFSGNTLSSGSHDHSFTTSSDGNHAHTFSGNTEAAHSHSFTVNSANTGSDNPIDNRPSFYKLAFIMKL